jgi:hypothetical protein
MNFRGRISVTFLLLVLSFQLSAKPFRRVLVLAGGSLSTATYTSIAEHMKMYGKKPDAIIATCGSSIASVIYSSFENNREGQLRFLESSTFQNLLLSARVVMTDVFEIKKMIDPVTPKILETMFDQYILEAPTDIRLPEAIDEFPTRGTRLIIGAGRILFQPGRGVPNSKYLFQETYFTDSNTAKYLRGKNSAIAKMYPNSRVMPTIGVKTGVDPMLAARASISDPILINPGIVDGSYYLTGGINLYPIEMAKELADEVYVTYPLKFKQYQSDIVVNSFGYSALDRQKKVSEMTGVHWIDLTGRDESFEPSAFMLFTVKSGVPKNPSTFARKTEGMWNFGWRKAYEAVTQEDPKNPTKHIKKLLKDQKA